MEDDYKTRSALANKGELKKLHKEIRDHYQSSGWRSTVGTFRIAPTALTGLVGDIIAENENKKKAKRKAKAEERAKKKAGKVSSKKSPAKKTAKVKATAPTTKKKLELAREKAPLKAETNKGSPRAGKKAASDAFRERLVAHLMKNRGRMVDELLVDLLK